MKLFTSKKELKQTVKTLTDKVQLQEDIIEQQRIIINQVAVRELLEKMGVTDLYHSNPTPNEVYKGALELGSQTEQSVYMMKECTINHAQPVESLIENETGRILYVVLDNCTFNEIK